MKLTQYNRKVMTNGGESSKFTAEMNAAFFAVASDTMYQYKIAAIIRETACNAYDSHIEAGIEDEPFNVILPNDFNPNLTIEDFGVGLDDEGVRTVFASYFKSTKNDSEKQTGGFGIGAKSVFSYSDTFEIVARKDGFERVYVAFIGEEGIPEVQIFSENPTDRRNGVRVKIPVQKEDFHRFRNEAAIILSFFPTTPVVTGGIGEFVPLVPDMHDQIAENGFARIPTHTGSDLYSGHSVYALVNNVIYPIPSSVYRDISNAAFINIISNHKSIVVKFEDGQLPPAAPRESLSLNEKTKVFIQNALDAILEVKRSEYQVKMDAFKHPIEAIQYAQEEFGFTGVRHFTYKGKTVGAYRGRQYKIPGVEYFSVARAKHGAKRKTVKGNLGLTGTSNFRDFVIVYRENGEKETPIKTHISKYIKKNNIEPDSTVFIVLDGCPANRPERVKSLMHVDATIIDNMTLREDVKSTRISSGITYNQGAKTDTTVFAKEIRNDGLLLKVSHIDVADGEYMHVPVSVLEQNKIASPSAFSDTLEFIVSNGNNINKLERLGVKNYEDYVNEWLKENPDFIRLVEFREVFDNSGFRNANYFHDKVMRMSADDDIVKCRKLHEEFCELSKKFGSVSECGVMIKAAKPLTKNDHIKTTDDVIAKIDKNYAVVRSVVDENNSRLLIKMVDFCTENGFNVEAELDKIKGNK